MRERTSNVAREPVDDDLRALMRILARAMVSREMATSLYVMWSRRKRLSKIGISASPHSRASQVRSSKGDETIRLITCWNILSWAPFESPGGVERAIHSALYEARLDDPSNSYVSEWFAMPWPAAVEYIEQFAQLFAPCGLLLERMPGNHGL